MSSGNDGPPPALQHDASAPRPLVVGPSSPAPPYPVYLEGKVQKGFGRGSKELGCPTGSSTLLSTVYQHVLSEDDGTANLPDSVIADYDPSTLATGVHYGYAKIVDFDASTSEHNAVWPMVMSLGWNPYYKNTKRTAVRPSSLPSLCYEIADACMSEQEVHILHEYPADFYEKHMKVVILGFIRPEFNYTTLGLSETLHRSSTGTDLNRAMTTDALIDDIETDKRATLASLDRSAFQKYRSDDFFTVGASY